jgi:hypothetical protein
MGGICHWGLGDYPVDLCLSVVVEQALVVELDLV